MSTPLLGWRKTGLYMDIHTWVQGLREIRNISQTTSDKPKHESQDLS
jgi:hypothetical protein